MKSIIEAAMFEDDEIDADRLDEYITIVNMTLMDARERRLELENCDKNNDHSYKIEIPINIPGIYIQKIKPLMERAGWVVYGTETNLSSRRTIFQIFPKNLGVQRKLSKETRK